MIATVHSKLTLPRSELRNGNRQRIISIGNVRYASNHDAQSGGATSGVSKGKGEKGAYLKNSRTVEYARATRTGILLESIDSFIKTMSAFCLRSILAITVPAPRDLSPSWVG